MRNFQDTLETHKQSICMTVLLNKLQIVNIYEIFALLLFGNILEINRFGAQTFKEI